MRIHYTPTPVSLHRYLLSLLGQHKMKVIGNGAFGMVFQHPTLRNVVVKVTAHEDGSFKWIRTCVMNQDNPHVPKIYGVFSFNGPYEYYDYIERAMIKAFTKLGYKNDIPTQYNGKYHVVFMEKLQSIDYGDLSFKEEQQLLEIATKEIFGEKIRLRSIRHLLATIEDTIKQERRCRSKTKRIYDSQFLDAIKLISRTSRLKNVGIDIHSGNIMVRNVLKTKKQFVFTDPLAVR